MKNGLIIACVAALAAVGVQAEEQQVKKMNILAFCAHPDDIELNVGGTLLKYRKQGHRIFIALTTSGNTGSNIMTNTEEIGRVREAEMLKSAALFGAEVRFLRNDDERLLDTNETRTQVLDAMRWADPDVIFTHNPHDESTDHAMTSKLVREMLLSLPGKNQQSSEKPCTKKVSLFYWEPSYGINYLPEVYVDISEECDEKLKGIYFHKSQFPYMAEFGCTDFAEEARTWARFRGIQNGCKYAETFQAHRIHGYMPDFKVLP